MRAYCRVDTWGDFANLLGKRKSSLRSCDFSSHADTAALVGSVSSQLHWPLCLPLDHHGPRANLIAMSNVADAQADEMAAAKLAVDG